MAVEDRRDGARSDGRLRHDDASSDLGVADVDALAPAAGAVVAGRPATVVTWVAAAAALVALLWWSGRQGFNPTDEGMIASASRRLLDGQAPHADFASPRPIGSTVLHLGEVLAPTPLLVTSRAVALAQLAAACVLFVRLASRRPVRLWGPGLIATATAATVLSVHTYPLMAWHTIDGIALSALALWAYDRWRNDAGTASLVLALASGGAAVVVKQSFAPLALALVVAALWSGRRAIVVVAALPGLAYVAWVAAAGGIDGAVAQMGTASSPGVSGGLEATFGEPVAMALAASGVLAVWRRRRGGRGIAVPLVVTAIVVGMPLVVGLEQGGAWGQGLFWAAAIVVVASLASPVDGATRPSPLVTGGALIVAWECCLSWGYAVPNLMAGPLAAIVLIEAWADVGPPSRPGLRSEVLRAAVASAAVVGLVVVAVAIRRDDIYRSRPADDLTVDLGTVAPEGRGILVDPSTADYVAAIAECSRTYGTDLVAVLPDNPAAYALLDLDSPLPTDWAFPPEISAIEDELRQAIVATEDRPDALLLFQVRSVEDLSGSAAQPATDGDSPYWYGQAPPVDAADGEPCGPFLAFGGATR